VGFAAGCGLVSDQTKQEAKKIEAKGQQAKQEAKKKVEAKGQQVKQEVKKKVEAGQEDLKQKVDELLKKVGAQEQQDQKK